MVTRFALLDWLALAILLYSVIMGARRGSIREAFGLAAAVAAFLAAAWLHAPVSRAFEDLVRTENIALFFGFSLVFAGILIAGFALIHLGRRFFQLARMEWFEGLLGGAFGFVRGWLIATVLFLGLTAFNVGSEAVRSSELSLYFLRGARAVAVLTPFDLKARFMVGYREIERWWSENLESDGPV